MEGEFHNIIVKRVVYEKDINGVNSIIFGTDEDGYFLIQRDSFIDLKEDPMYKKPYIEMNEQNGHYYDILKVLFSQKTIYILLERCFLSKNQILINMQDDVNAKIIDFFVNNLFLGSVVEYSDDVDLNLHIKQTIFRTQY